MGALIPHSDLSQLMKIKALSEHFQIHQLEARQNGVDFSFSDFIYEHFVTGDEHEHEESDHDSHHEDLPCKQLSPGQTYLVSSFMSPIICQDVLSFNTHLLDYKSFFYEEDYLASVYQPPAA